MARPARGGGSVWFHQGYGGCHEAVLDARDGECAWADVGRLRRCRTWTWLTRCTVIVSPHWRVSVRPPSPSTRTRTLTPSPPEITHSFLHYLAHYQIFPPNEEPYLHASLHATIDTSTRLLPQIQLAQLIADALPGSSSAAAGDSWHALALGAWIRAPLVRSETEWEVNAQRMRERVEGTFTDAREESMARNVRDGLVGVGGDGDGDGEEEKQVEEGEGEAEGVDEYRYESDGEPQETAADWQDAETPGKHGRLLGDGLR